MDNRGVDTDPGWVNRKLRELRHDVEAIRSERRFRNLDTTSATANMVVDATTGNVLRSTSSARYKQDITDLDLDLADILKMRPRMWRDRKDVAAHGDRAPYYIGFVAEELHDAGLGYFVGYDKHGDPEAVNYDRLTVALLIGCRALFNRLGLLTDRVTSLEEEVTSLRQSGATLAGRVTALTTRTKTLEDSVTVLTARIVALESPPEPPPEPPPA